jgi:alpha-glucosidase
VTWYDYWTGKKIERHASNATQDPAEAAEAKNPGRALATKPLIIHPKLDVLPVYVREGSILPMQPVTQSHFAILSLSARLHDRTEQLLVRIAA